ncbi:NAD(P)-dependent oxidoreductase [Variovorax paradoxus]|nr:NAD(P)-dependent oxidoreductase [Variovorax paradoxus]
MARVPHQDRLQAAVLTRAAACLRRHALTTTGEIMKVGFIGLGRMGAPMARRIVKAGVPLLVYDIAPAAMQALVETGAQAAGSVAEVAGDVDVLFTSLPAPSHVEEVVLGAQGVLAHMKPGLVLFEMSTSSMALNRRMEAEFRRKGGALLDAPVAGGPAGAASGDLAIWVGGEKEVYERHLNLLRAIGDKPRHVGPIGAGTIAKLSNNMAAYMILLTMAEIFSVGVKGGVDPLELWQALCLGTVGKQSPMFLLTNQFLPGKFDDPTFLLKLAHKDMSLGAALAKELGVPMRLGNMTLEEMTEGLTRGWGELDSRAYLKLQLERAGVNIAVEPERVQAAVQAMRA